MHIREANDKDAEDIKNLHLQAFDDSEAAVVADFAISLLHEKTSIKIISLVAIEDDVIIGHVAFSPVFLDDSNEHFGYILAPLAVLPDQQNNRIGSALVKHGLDMISSSGTHIVFVYGDPGYYCRFGFSADLAQSFTPPYTLRYSEGWHALRTSSADIPEGGSLRCVESLNDAGLW
jgi:putative acetyltransferase